MDEEEPVIIVNPNYLTWQNDDGMEDEIIEETDIGDFEAQQEANMHITR